VIRLVSADERPPVVRLADPPEPLVIGRGLSADGPKAGFTAFFGDAAAVRVHEFRTDPISPAAAFSETRRQSEFRSSGVQD